MAGTIILAVIGLFILLGKDAKTSQATKKHREELEDQGFFLPENQELHDRFVREAYDDWHEDKTMFPEEYWIFFTHVSEGLHSYISSIASKKEAEAGYKPIRHFYYNKYTFDPFVGFNNRFVPQIKDFNKRVEQYRTGN